MKVEDVIAGVFKAVHARRSLLFVGEALSLKAMIESYLVEVSNFIVETRAPLQCMNTRRKTASWLFVQAANLAFSTRRLRGSDIEYGKEGEKLAAILVPVAPESRAHLYDEDYKCVRTVDYILCAIACLLQTMLRDVEAGGNQFTPSEVFMDEAYRAAFLSIKLLKTLEARDEQVVVSLVKACMAE